MLSSIEWSLFRQHIALVDSCVTETSCHREKRLIGFKYAFIFGFIRDVSSGLLSSRILVTVVRLQQVSYFRPVNTGLFVHGC